MQLFIRHSWFNQPQQTESLTDDQLLADVALNQRSEADQDTYNQLQALRSYLAQLSKTSPLPQLIYLISAGEANVLLDGQVKDFAVNLEKDNFTLKFVGSACTSFHAAILDFSASTETEALILHLELNKERQQDCLDALGIGMGFDQDGLDVVTGVAVNWISKSKSEADFCQISQCDILSQPLSLKGMPSLIFNLRKLINHDQNANVVSFSIRSKWGQQLLKGIPETNVKKWLPSLEPCGKHYLSIKPIREMHRYWHAKCEDSLWLLTLGGGGRVGCLKISSPEIDTQFFSCNEINIKKLCLYSAYCQFAAALQVRQHSKDAFYSMVRNAMSYPSKQYRGTKNQLFYWHVSRSWQSLDDYQGVRNG